MTMVKRFAALGFLAAVVAVGFASFGGTPNEQALLSDWAGAVPPWPVLRAAETLERFLVRASNAVLPPPITTLQLMQGFGKSQVLYALARFNVADHLASGTKTAAELAELSGVPDADAMWRVLRLAVGMGILAGSGDTASSATFRNNAISATLREDHPNSMKHFVCHLAEDTMPAWNELVPGMRAGKTPWDLFSPNETVWPYMAARPEQEKQFSKAMTAVDNLGMAAALADYPWAAHSRIIDVGGAYGSLVAAVLRQHPTMKGVVFDLPQVAERAEAEWRRKHPAVLQQRVQFVGGSFFDEGSVPAAESDDDVYVMRVVLHDWPDADVVRILKSVRAAIGNTKAKVAIMETMPQEGLNTANYAPLWLDIHMHVVVNGKERTPAQWVPLLREAGLKTTGVFPQRSIFTIVQAAAAT